MEAIALGGLPHSVPEGECFAGADDESVDAAACKTDILGFVGLEHRIDARTSLYHVVAMRIDEYGEFLLLCGGGVFFATEKVLKFTLEYLLLQGDGIGCGTYFAKEFSCHNGGGMGLFLYEFEKEV